MTWPIYDVVVVDDERTFASDEETHYCRSSLEAIGVLGYIWNHQQNHYAPALRELWLDHDLGGDYNDSIVPVVEFLTTLHKQGNPIAIDNVFVHTMNAYGGDITVMLLRLVYGDKVRRVPLPELA